MAIDTAERRRSVVDFGKITGTGMPIPSGTIGLGPRGHILNLYPGISPISIPFIGWRTRTDADDNFAWRTRTDIAD